MKFWVFILLILLLTNCSATKNLNHTEYYSSEEKQKIELCNTARYAWYMGYDSKKIIMLVNLVRVYPFLFKKYIDLQTDTIYRNHALMYSRINKRINSNNPISTCILKPSFNLFLASKIHSIYSGIVGETGHQHLTSRLRITLNFNRIYGENCIYGYHGGFEAIVGWIESNCHYQNMIQPYYYRTGVSGARHIDYGINYVQVFSGKKWKDVLR